MNTLRARIALTSAWLLTACFGQVAQPEAGASDMPSTPSKPAPVAPEEPSVYRDALMCRAPAQTQMFPGTPRDFTMKTEGFSPWEGKALVVAAVEPMDHGAGVHRLHRPVLIRTTIGLGEFTLTCPGSLTELAPYPSWAAFIDMDGDGHCTAVDVGFFAQVYGWYGAELLPSMMLPVELLRAPAVGEYAALPGVPPFCAAFFEAPYPAP